jgi:phage terminase large subunit-like protein
MASRTQPQYRGCGRAQMGSLVALMRHARPRIAKVPARRGGRDYIAAMGAMSGTKTKLSAIGASTGSLSITLSQPLKTGSRRSRSKTLTTVGRKSDGICLPSATGHPSRDLRDALALGECQFFWSDILSRMVLFIFDFSPPRRGSRCGAMTIRSCRWRKCMQFRPLHDRVVKRFEADEKAARRVIIPATAPPISSTPAVL